MDVASTKGLVEKNTAVREEAGAKEKTGFTLRAVLIGLAMLLFMCVITYEMRSNGFFFGIPFTPIIEVFYFIFGPNMSSLMPMMLIIAVVNPLLLRLRKEIMFTMKELIVINVIAGIGSIAIQIPLSLILYAPILPTRNFAFRGTGIWGREEIVAGLSPVAFITDPEFVMRIAEGGNPVEWGAWLPRLFVWFLFFGAVFFVNTCMAVLVRRRWTEMEHLPYPVARFQLVLVKGQTGFESPAAKRETIWSNKLLWLGFTLGGLWAFPACIARFIPGVPYIDQLKMNTWKNNILKSSEILFTADGASVPIVNPLIIGLLWYAPLDLLFSIWFFSVFRFWITALLLVMGAKWTGFVQGNLASVLWMRRDSAAGAIVALGILYLWNQRVELKRVVAGAFSGIDLNDQDEPLSYRTAVFGILLGTIFIITFSTAILKVALIWSVLYALVTIIGSLGIGRMRADTGAVHQTLLHEYMGPLLVGAFGNRHFSYNTLRGMGFLDASMTFSSLVAVPATALEAWQMGDEVNAPRKTISIAFFLSIIAAFFFITFYSLPVLYRYGRPLLIGGSHYGFWVESSIVQNLTLSKEHALREQPPQVSKIVWPLISASAVFILGYLRNRYVWWPFHPVGWAIGFGHHSTWFDLMSAIVWVVKFIVMRYGGMQLFKSLTPMFIGISLSQVANAFLYVIMIGLKLAGLIR